LIRWWAKKPQVGLGFRGLRFKGLRFKGVKFKEGAALRKQKATARGASR
jgi:hypothetical protein